MRIDKLHLQDFGQFHEEDISLAPGINVICGGSDTGKTTIKDFIVDMIYGINREPGAGVRIDHYEKTRPINGSGFSGAMEFCVEGEAYQVERNFLQQDKSTKLRDLDENKDMALQEEHSLKGTLLNTSKNIYESTLCMGHNELAVGKDLMEELDRYIISKASTKVGDINVSAALDELEQKKKSYSNTELAKREKELTAKLSLERDFDGEIEAIRKEYEKVEASVKDGKEEKLQFTPIKNPVTESRMENAAKKQDDEPEQPATKRERDIQMLQGMGKKSILDNVFVIWFLSLALIAVFVAIAQIVPVNIPALKMGIIGFGIVLVLMTTFQVLSRRSKLHLLLEDMEIEQGFRDAKAGNTRSADWEEAQKRLTELRLKEQNTIKERSQQEKAMAELDGIKTQMQANEIELEALSLAISTIRDLSDDIYDSYGSVLNARVSQLVDRITLHRYQEVKIDDQLRILVKKDNSFISVDYLSVSTIEQIYFALRLALAELVLKDNMPILIDDIFANYDEQRLKETLSCLSEYLQHQIIIFTVNPDVQQLFTDLGMESRYIAL